MDVAIVTLLSGLAYGVVLFLIACGLSFVLGLMGIVNIAHGCLVMTGAYVGLAVAKWTGSFWLAGLCAALLCLVVGVIIERGFLRTLYNRQLEQILVTFGFVYIISNLHLWFYGPFPQSGFVPTSLTVAIPIGNYTFPLYRLIIIAFGVILCPVLWYAQDRTKIGALIRAGMDDPVTIGSMGINLTPINIAAFGLASLLAGVVGFVGAPVLGTINTQMGSSVVWLAIAVVIVGGVGSIQGSLVGALLIGVATIAAGTYVPFLAAFVPYALMVIVMILRPAGLLGRK